MNKILLPALLATLSLPLVTFADDTANANANANDKAPSIATDTKGNPIGSGIVQDPSNPVEYVIGDLHFGGVVFWLDPDSKPPLQHGLAAHIVDQPGGFAFAWDTNNTFSVIGADGNDIYAGKNKADGNTSRMASMLGINSPAATTCVKLNVQQYNDWYLPSLVELAILYDLRSTINDTATANGGDIFQASRYWSSTEDGQNFARYYNFAGYPDYILKSSKLAVRCIRAF